MTEATGGYVNFLSSSGSQQIADAAEAIKAAATSAHQRASDLAGSAAEKAKGTANSAYDYAKNVAAGTAESAKAAGVYASGIGKTWSDWARERVISAVEAVSQ